MSQPRKNISTESKKRYAAPVKPIAPIKEVYEPVNSEETLADTNGGGGAEEEVDPSWQYKEDEFNEVTAMIDEKKRSARYITIAKSLADNRFQIVVSEAILKLGGLDFNFASIKEWKKSGGETLALEISNINGGTPSVYPMVKMDWFRASGKKSWLPGSMYAKNVWVLKLTESINDLVWD